MPVVELFDGTKLEFPEGTNQSVIDSTAKRETFRLKALQTNARQADIAQNGATAADLTAAGLDPTKDMTGGQKFVAGYGKVTSDVTNGVKQLLNIGDQNALKKEIDDSKRMDQSLLNTGAGLAGNIAGWAVPAVGATIIPGANTYAGAGLTGAVMGALNPVGTGDSRLWNTGFGAATSVLGQSAGNILGKVLKPVANQSDEAVRLAGIAKANNIPLSAADATGSKPLQFIDSVLSNLPISGGAQAAKKAAQQDAFNAAVLKTAGIDASKATPEILAAQKKVLGNTFEDIASRNAIDLNKGVANDLVDIVGQAQRRLTPADASRISNAVEDIFSQADTGGTLPGTLYQAWRSELGRMSKSNDSTGHFAGQLKKTLDRAFDSQVSAADQAAWKQASKQYGNLKTIADAAGGAGTAANLGDISAAQLSSALGKQVGREGKALGRGELNDLSRVGNVFIKPQVPDSGTAQRALYQGLLTQGAGGLGVGGLSGMTGDNGFDWNRALIGGGAAIGGPALAQAILHNPVAQAYLKRGLLNLTPAQINAMKATGRIGLLSTTLALESTR